MMLLTPSRKASSPERDGNREGEREREGVWGGVGAKKPQSTRGGEKERGKKRRKINELVTVAFANWALRVCECWLVYGCVCVCVCVQDSHSHYHTHTHRQEETAAVAAGRRQALMI